MPQDLEIKKGSENQELRIVHMVDLPMNRDRPAMQEEVNMLPDQSIKIVPTIADLLMATIVMKEGIFNKNRIDHKTIIARIIMAVIDRIVTFSLDMVVHRRVDLVAIDKTTDLVVNMVIVPNMVVQVVMRIVAVMKIVAAVADSIIVIPVVSIIAVVPVLTIVEEAVLIIVALMNKDRILDLVVNMEIAHSIVVLPVVVMTIMKEDQDNSMIVVDMANRE